MKNKLFSRSKICDTLWYIFGSIFYGFTSLIYMIIITRLIDIDATGQFSFAFAVASTFYVIGVYFGMAFQVTDNSDKYSDTDFIFNRFTTCIIMIVLTLLFSIINGYDSIKFFLVLLLVIYRGVDAMLDSTHAIIQKKDRMYKNGILTFVRTLFLIGTFLITALLFKNLVISIVSITIVDIIYSLLIEYAAVKKLIKPTKYSTTKNIMLLIEGFPVFLFSFLAMLILNSPKYAIDANLSNSLQGIFGIIFMPSSFMSLISLYLIHPFLNDISMNINNNDQASQNRLMIKLTTIIILFGLIVTVIAYILGIPVLELMYGINLSNHRLGLVIIMIGTILYSIYGLFSMIFLAMRKNFHQVIILVIVSILSYFICDCFVSNYGIMGASYAYLLVMFIQVLLYICVYALIIHNSKKQKKIAIRLMGGLGNQMFQYAAVRSFALDNDVSAYIDLRGITNKTHNVFGLNHCNISNDVIIKKSIFLVKGKITHLIYGLYWAFLSKTKIGYKLYSIMQPNLNDLGIYCVPDGYIPINKVKARNNYMVGYYQSINYIKSNMSIIQSELQIIDKLEGKNLNVYNEIKKCNSVCIHVRRGDYVGSSFEVCNVNYYLDAIKLMKSKIKDAHFYVFSDDICWVKANFNLDNTTYIDWKNNQYQDLKLMSGCKNFIMSNSSFSYWAQFLSKNDKKVVIAPSMWYKNGSKSDIYDDSWYLIDIR